MSPTEVNRLPLNGRAKSYLEELLSQGHSLAQLLRRRKDLVQSPATTYLPFVPDDEALYAFHRGIFAEFNPEHLPRGGWVATPNVDDSLNDLLRDFLHRSQEASILFEEYLLRSDDLSSGGIETQTLLFGQEVYHLLTHDDADNRSLVEATTRRARSWQFLGALSTVLPRDVLKSGILTEQRLQEFAEHATSIVVGAYDNEGFILYPD